VSLQGSSGVDGFWEDWWGGGFCWCFQFHVFLIYSKVVTVSRFLGR
jgi:hypothetical protein